MQRPWGWIIAGGLGEQPEPAVSGIEEKAIGKRSEESHETKSCWLLGAISLRVRQEARGLSGEGNIMFHTSAESRLQRQKQKQGDQLGHRCNNPGER